MLCCCCCRRCPGPGVRGASRSHARSECFVVVVVVVVQGLVFAVLADRTRDLNALLTQLSRSPSLSDRVALPTGIRFIFTLEGRKVSSRRLAFLFMLRFCVSKFMLYIFKIKSYNLLAFILFF